MNNQEKLKELEEEQRKLADKIKKVRESLSKKPQNPMDVKKSDKNYWINGDMDILYGTDYGDKSIGNEILSKKLAEWFRDYQFLTYRMVKDAIQSWIDVEEKFDWENGHQPKYFLEGFYTNTNIQTSYRGKFHCGSFPKFQSRKSLENSINKHKKLIDKVFGKDCMEIAMEWIE